MASIDSIEKQLVPEQPKVIDTEQTTVYVPIATDSTPGIAKFNISDFAVDKNGNVQLRYSQKNIVKLADPLNSPSYVKLSKDEFKYISNPDERYPNAEVILRRDATANNAFDKASLIKLNVNDFNLINENDENITYVNWPVDPFNDSGKLSFVFNSKYFDFTNKVITANIPHSGKDNGFYNGFGLIKVNEQDELLKFSEDDVLYIDTDALKTEIEQETYITPNYEFVRLDYLQADPNTGNKTVAKKQAYFKQDTVVDGKTYLANAEVPVDVDVTGINVYYRTILKIDSISVGLGNVENVSVTEKIKSDVLPKINEKADILAVEQSFKAVSEEINAINTKLVDLQSLKTTKFLGYIANENGKPYKKETDEGYVSNSDFLGELGKTIFVDKFNPYNTNISADSYAVFGNTGTLIFVHSDSNFTTIDETRYWFDSDLTNTTLNSYLEYKASVNSLGVASNNLKIDGVASYGTSDYFSPIDHVHPENPNLFKFKIGDGIRTISVNDKSVELDNSTSDLHINLPYTESAKEIHNWLGNFVNGVPNYSYSESSLVKTWIGTTEEYLNEFKGKSPADVLVYITDDSLNFEGDLLDVETFNKKTSEFYANIKSNAVAGTTYLYSPTAQKDFYWQPFNKNDYLPIYFNNDVNILLNEHNFRVNARSISTLAQKGTSTDVYYSVVPAIPNAKEVSLGDNTGKYVSLNTASVEILKQVENKYNPILSDIDSDIANLENDFNSINLNNYLLKSDYNTDKQTFALKSELSGKVNKTDAISFTDNENQTQSGTFSTISQLLKAASSVRYKNNTTVQANSLNFVVCTLSEYNSLTKSANTLYFVTD